MKLGLANALIASVLGHTAALAVWPTAPPKPAEMPRLYVQLQQTPAAAGQGTTEPAKDLPEPKPAVTREHMEVPSRRAEPERATRSTARVTAESPTELHKKSENRLSDAARPEPASGESSAKSLEPPRVATAPVAAPSTTPRPLVLARLHEALRAHFSYPMLARRHGWEGQVLVGVHIENSGRIRGIHVARSSGYGVLDRSAVEALDRVGDLPGVETGGRTLELQIPVIYRLQEG